MLTFTPLHPTKGEIRTLDDSIDLRSWTDQDIDVNFKKNHLVHFSGPARMFWNHAIRIGVRIRSDPNDTYDWFGDTDHLVLSQQR